MQIDRMEKEHLHAKMMAEQNQCGQAQAMAALMQSPDPAKPGLRERIASQRYRAEKHAGHADGLRELEYMLDKHPEVARILDLLDLVKD